MREVSGSVLSEQAPRLIFEGPWHTYYVQVQEQIVGHALRWPARVTSHHVDFLSKLLTIGRKSLPLSETVTWRRLKVFADSAASETLPQSIHFMLQRVFSSELAKRRVICHRTHGDFVAWNIRVSGTRLSAYDWESSLSDGLALTDLLHYLYGYASHVGLWPGERAMLGRMRKSAILLARRENLRADQYDLYVWIWLLGEYVAHPCKYILDMSEVLACQAIP